MTFISASDSPLVSISSYLSEVEPHHVADPNCGSHIDDLNFKGKLQSECNYGYQHKDVMTQVKKTEGHSTEKHILLYTYIHMCIHIYM